MMLPSPSAAFMKPMGWRSQSGGHVQAYQVKPSSPSSLSTVLYAKRRRKGDSDADFERFDLDELRDEKRFESVDEIDPEMFRPSKMEYYVPPPEDMEKWDVTDTR